MPKAPAVSSAAKITLAPKGFDAPAAQRAVSERAAHPLSEQATEMNTLPVGTVLIVPESSDWTDEQAAAYFRALNNQMARFGKKRVKGVRDTRTESKACDLFVLTVYEARERTERDMNGNK